MIPAAPAATQQRCRTRKSRSTYAAAWPAVQGPPVSSTNSNGTSLAGTSRISAMTSDGTACGVSGCGPLVAAAVSTSA
jgi:hypothetical protein